MYLNQPMSWGGHHLQPRPCSPCRVTPSWQSMENNAGSMFAYGKNWLKIEDNLKYKNENQLILGKSSHFACLPKLRRPPHPSPEVAMVRPSPSSPQPSPWCRHDWRPLSWAQAGTLVALVALVGKALEVEVRARVQHWDLQLLELLGLLELQMLPPSRAMQTPPSIATVVTKALERPAGGWRLHQEPVMVTTWTFAAIPDSPGSVDVLLSIVGAAPPHSQPKIAAAVPCPTALRQHAGRFRWHRFPLRAARVHQVAGPASRAVQPWVPANIPRSLVTGAPRAATMEPKWPWHAWETQLVTKLLGDPSEGVDQEHLRRMDPSSVEAYRAIDARKARTTFLHVYVKDDFFRATYIYIRVSIYIIFIMCILYIIWYIYIYTWYIYICMCVYYIL